MKIHKFATKRNKAFSLVELMVVIVIIGLLAGVVGVQVINKLHKARVTTAQSQIGILENAIQSYKIDLSQYPEKLEDLVQDPGIDGWDTKGYLDGELPNDPWGNPYVYDTEPASGRDYSIFSYGADGQEGGDGENADVFSLKETKAAENQ